ncbi:MAG TPA: hypothetical protein DDW73_03325 [Rhizobium sp.]|jgi:LuxR family transcriptional regulator, maltose regulon positive regulatory protein|nr:hypothetical protein [Rhizobium sp.]
MSGIPCGVMFLRRTNLLNRRSLPPHTSAGVIDRPRLTSLAGFLARHRLALIHAPAGSGKTTLLAQWYQAAHAADVHTVWYSASDLDRDPIHFADYLLLAIEQTTGFSGDFIPTSDNADALRRLVGVVADLVLARPLVLFIDDYHLSEANGGAETINALLSARLANVTIVLASRNRPSFALGRYRANGEMIEVSVKDLQFDEGETEAFFRLVSDVALSSTQSRQMHNHTEGWAAGLRLASLVLGRTSENFMEAAPAGSHRAFADYFLEEVISGLPATVYDFLTQTSILETFNADLCDAVTGRNDAGATLVRLEEGQLFIVTLPGQQRWYKYHHLFQEFLQTRLYGESLERFCDAHARAAKWFIASGSPIYAVRHAFLARQPQWAAELIESYCLYDYLSHGRFETYSHWMQQLPRNSREERPLLMFLLVWRYINLRRFLQAEQTLKAIETAASDPKSRLSMIARDNGVDIKGRLRLMRALIGSYGGDFSVSQMHLKALDNRELDQLAFGQVDLDSIQSYVAYNEGDLVRAERLTFKAKGIYDAMACHWGGIHSRCIAAMSYLARGWFSDAEVLLKDAFSVAKEHFAETSYMVALPCALLGIVSQNAGDELQAEDLWLRAIPAEALTHVSGLSERVLVATINLGRLYDSQGRSEEASALLAHASLRAYETEDFRLEFQLAIERADRALRSGNAAEGRREWERIGLQLTEAQRRFPSCIWQIWDAFAILEARMLAAGGLMHVAIERLDAVAKVARAQGRSVAAAQCEALAIVYRYESSNTNDSRKAIQAYMDQAEEVGLARVIQTFVFSFPEIPAKRGNAVHPGARPKPERDALLTGREIEVLELLQVGLSNKDIAARLGINLNTVKSHVKSIFEKLDVKTRTQAVLRTL